MERTDVIIRCFPKGWFKDGQPQDPVKLASQVVRWCCADNEAESDGRPFQFPDLFENHVVAYDLVLEIVPHDDLARPFYQSWCQFVEPDDARMVEIIPADTRVGMHVRSHHHSGVFLQKHRIIVCDAWLTHDNIKCLIAEVMELLNDANFMAMAFTKLMATPIEQEPGEPLFTEADWKLLDEIRTAMQGYRKLREPFHELLIALAVKILKATEAKLSLERR